MAKASANPAAPVVLVCGDDDFTVKQRAKALYDQWCGELGGMDHEIVDAVAANTGDALGRINKHRAALDTLPFFGGAKAVWFRDCNFLGEDRTASSAAVITHRVTAGTRQAARRTMVSMCRSLRSAVRRVVRRHRAAPEWVHWTRGRWPPRE